MRIQDHPVLDFSDKWKKKVKFTFDGRVLDGYEGEPIVAALHDHGVRKLVTSPRHHRPRGFYCAIGKCSSCLMEVDGIPNVRICMTPLAEGMTVNTQKPLEAEGAAAERGER